MTPPPQNWVFLGDSLTEGVGSLRVSYVSELARKLRERELRNTAADRRSVQEVRLRHVDPGSLSRFVRFNMAGCWDPLEEPPGSSITAAPRALWIWNLASEGCTIESDFRWVPWLENLRPDRVFLFRGSLESLVRPSALKDGSWPWWVPRSWRGYAALDPRCYFSTTWWRRAKQIAVDSIKQRLRRSLLRSGPGTTLVAEKDVIGHLDRILQRLRSLSGRISILGLLPVSDATFPGSDEQFQRVNGALRDAAARHGVDFVDWGGAMRRDQPLADSFYLDGFHPNRKGAESLAAILLSHLEAE